MSGGDLLNYSSCSAAAQLLSIPSQQPDPPKHSTPKKGGEDYGRPMFDESSICDDFDRKSTISSGERQRVPNKATIISEKARMSNFIEEELQRRRTISSSEISKERAFNGNNQGRGDELMNLSSNAGPLPPYGKMPKFEAHQFSRPPSSVSDTDTIATRTSKLAFERGKDKLNFYNVPLGESLVLRLRMWNMDSVQMRIKCTISSEDSKAHLNFKILEVTSPIMESGMQCEIAVQYTPTKIERNFAHLVIERINYECFKKTFHLIGDGGRAELSLAGSNFSDGVAKQASSSQAIVIQPDECNHFWLEFQNQGQRSAYVKLVAINRIGKSISSEQVCMRPDQFVLNPVGQGQDRWKVSVCVSEAFNWLGTALLQQQKDIVMGKRVSNGHQHQRRESGRESVLSSSSGATSSSQQQPECSFRIEAHWGEEEQRQRLKCWQWKSRQLATVRGLRFTDKFEGEQQMRSSQRQRMCATSLSNELADFQNSLRLCTLNVINIQAASFFPSGQSEIRHPLIEMFRNKSRLLRETLPDEDSYNASAMFLTIPPLTPL